LIQPGSGEAVAGAPLHVGLFVAGSDLELDRDVLVRAGTECG
jgi:hypothetical protein